MPKIIQLDQLAESILHEMNNYNEYVEMAVDEETRRLAKELVNDLKNDPSVPRSNRTLEHYKDGFYMKKWSAKSKKRGYVIANKQYQLTHLLEHGHVTRNGGRSRAFPHWAQANRKSQDLVIAIRKRLEGGK